MLANHALYDRFYFSTFATDGKVTPDTVFEGFLKSGKRLASQAYQAYLPPGRTVEEAKEELFAAGKPKATAYQTAAAAGAGAPGAGGMPDMGAADTASAEPKDKGKVVDADFEVVDKDNK